MQTQKTAEPEKKAKPTKAKSLPKSSHATQGRKSAAGYVRAARPPAARGAR